MSSFGRFEPQNPNETEIQNLLPDSRDRRNTTDLANELGTQRETINKSQFNLRNGSAIDVTEK